MSVLVIGDASLLARSASAASSLHFVPCTAAAAESTFLLCVSCAFLPKTLHVLPCRCGEPLQRYTVETDSFPRRATCFVLRVFKCGALRSQPSSHPAPVTPQKCEHFLPPV